FRACITTLPETRCWEAAEFRLLHVTAQGTPVPGWPATGFVFEVALSLDGTGVVDILPEDPAADGAARGALLVWLDGTPANAIAPPVLAQRFLPDGSTLWPGGLAGFTVLGPQTERVTIQFASDHAGGCVVVAEQLAGGSSTRYELRAGRVTG